MGPVSGAWRFWLGLGAGVSIAGVDYFAFEGEVSPIVIVVMLFGVAAAATGAWGRRGLGAAATAWACVPLTHIGAHALGMPDTLQPNTYTAIFQLAALTLLVAGVGAACGALAFGARRQA